MIEMTLPRTVSEARSADGSYRAGGTDLTELRHRGIVQGPVVDLRDVPELDAVGPGPDGGLRLGALVRLSRVAADPQVVSAYPGVAAAAGGLATPQIRSRATLAGSRALKTLLADLGPMVEREKVQSPAIIVVGEVVQLSDAQDKLAGWARQAEAMHGFDL